MLYDDLVSRRIAQTLRARCIHRMLCTCAYELFYLFLTRIFSRETYRRASACAAWCVRTWHTQKYVYAHARVCKHAR